MKLIINYEDYDSPDSRIDAVTVGIEKAQDIIENSYSILMFFRDAIPLRIRSNKISTLTLDKGKLLSSLERWSTDGQGPMIIRTSSRKHMNDIYPSKTVRESTHYDGSDEHRVYFHYYDGRYGNRDLWRLVRSARDYNTSVGKAVTRFFQQRSLSQCFNDIRHSERVDYNEDYVRTPRDFRYTVYNSLGDRVVDIGREGDKTWDEYTPMGSYFLGVNDE